MHCLSCGELTDATNRRSLTNDEGRCVAEVWREFIVTEDLEIDVEQLLSGDQHPSMCRKCYSAYKTCHKYQQTIKCNLKNAIVVLDSNPAHSSLSVLVPSPKRPRIGWSSSSSGANRSPDVLVGAA